MPIYHLNHKLGKKEPRHDHRTLRLARYITPKLAPAPNECDWTQKLNHLGMMLNDQIGDCTCATVGHMIQTWTANTRAQQVIIPDADILSLYEKVGGYVPGDESTDQGAVVLDVLNYWRKNPVDGNELGAYAAVDPQMILQVKQAIYYFGGAYIGLALPITAQSQDVWTVSSLSGDGEPGSWGGHAVPVVKYDKKYVYCITWGALKAMSWNFFYGYCEEAYALFSNDWLTNSGTAPNGFDDAQLNIDLQTLELAS